jgi:hypothetical protein
MWCCKEILTGYTLLCVESDSPTEISIFILICTIAVILLILLVADDIDSFRVWRKNRETMKRLKEKRL